MPAPEIFAGPRRVHFFASGEVQSSTPCRAPLRSVVPVSIHPPLGSRAIDASPIGLSEKIGATGFASAAGITVAFLSIDGWSAKISSATAVFSFCCASADGASDSAANDRPVIQLRSEEHTSELQSLMRISYAVFCLKKK